MPSVGLEPTRRKHRFLKPACLPFHHEGFFVIIKILLVVVNNSLNRYEFAFDYDTAFLLVLLPMAQKVTRKVTRPLVTLFFYL